MPKYLDIDLAKRTVKSRELSGREIAKAGRYFIAKTLLETGVATIDPMSQDNPLIFSAGPFAGTNFSNANRLSVGCKSPLTGGVKEANSGGTFAFAMGQLEISGFTLHGACEDWTILHIPLEGEIAFKDATSYLGLGNIECAKKLHQEYGDKVSLALCGPVGEYHGLIAGITFSDDDNRPSRLAARGGVGAVFGSKKIKAIVIEKYKMPPLHDRKPFMGHLKKYGKMLGETPAVEAFSTTGTAMVGDLTNYIGALPTRNFSAGSIAKGKSGEFELGGDFIRELNKSRGGEISHACMPGCMIKCSNIFVDSTGKELVSPLEYETIGLLGTNCGLTNVDDVARLNERANDLGIDTIELGATIGVMMDVGEGKFGDVEFMNNCLSDLQKGNERGRLIAQGTARVGSHFNCARVPVIKKQAISAYDPRVIEVTGVSMMLTAQGADHTTGNAPAFKTDDLSMKEIVAESLKKQINCTIADSFGLCIFGRDVTDVNLQLIADAANDAHDCGINVNDIKKLGLDTLLFEAEFNRQAGFKESDDELPEFFHAEALPPSGKIARLQAPELNQCINELIAELKASPA